jgi:hypothetical protein
MSQNDVTSRFEHVYENWKSYVARSGAMEHSADEAYINNPAFHEIVALGPDAISLIIDKLQRDPDAHFLVHALPELTGKSFLATEIEAAREKYGSPLGNQGYARMWIDWWKQSEKK